MMKDTVNLMIDYPANIADKLLSNEIDIGLVPVAVLPQLTSYFIVSNYCIGCDGAVESVCLFSNVPLEKIERIFLDYQSKTSVELLKILLKEHWKISPQLMQAGEGFEENLSGNTAGLIIGDRAFMQRKKSVYSYDLGEAWKELTGLPFVFAAWVSNKELPASFINEFNSATAYGVQNINVVVNDIAKNSINLEDYYKNRISYLLDDRKKEALQLFLSKIS